MTTRITEAEWIKRALSLNLQWINEPPIRNDIKSDIRCLDCGHEWKVLPANVAKGRKNCPKCNQVASRVGPKEWQKRIAEQESVWLSDTPETLSDLDKLAKCLRCGKQWKVNPRRLYKGLGHPRCPATKPQGLLADSIWDDRARKAGIEWLEAPLNSKTKTPARCLTCNHVWKPTPSNITQGSGCPKCPKTNRTGIAVSKEQWLERAAKANIKWIGSTPINARIKHPAQCLTCSYKWEVNPSNISKGSKCPACAKNSKVPQSTWDERASALGLEWLEPVRGRHSKAKLKCLKCSHIWLCEAGAVARGSGCPKCADISRYSKRRLPTHIWVDRAEKLDLDWIELPTNNSDKKLIRCRKCSYEWKIIPSKIATNSGCPKCTGTLVTEEMWLERASAVNITWLEIPSNSRVGTSAQCNNCKLIWKPVPDAVRGGSGCPDCAITGYKYGEPGLLYLVERTSGQGRSARKIGITNVAGSKVRINLWRRQDFVLLKTINHDNGQLIYELEQQVLRWLRFELKLPQYLDKEEMPLGGATETFDPEVPTMANLVEKIDSLYDELKIQFDR